MKKSENQIDHKAATSPEEERDVLRSKDRRKFLKSAGKVAVVAPAVTLLVSASLKSKEAEAKMYTYDPGPWIP